MTESPEEFIAKKKQERIGHLSVQKDVTQEAEYTWEIEAVTLMLEKNDNRKVYEIARERLVKVTGESKIHPDQKTRLRFSYWIITRKGNWGYGQFSPVFPIYDGKCNDIFKLLEKAKEEGTIKEE